MWRDSVIENFPTGRDVFSLTHLKSIDGFNKMAVISLTTLLNHLKRNKDAFAVLF